MERVIKPEILDDLPSADPQAIGSRGDLRRLNTIMGHAGILNRSLHGNLKVPTNPLRIIELGAGDGTFLLHMVRHLSAQGITGHATLIDRQNLLSPETRAVFTALGWSVDSVQADVLEWLASAPVTADVMLANLFLHHFPPAPLQTLLRLAALKTNLFLACEPQRGLLPLTAARLLGLIGCNAVTRHDAVVSVRAGFRDDELSSLWPTTSYWRLTEGSAGLFSHRFIARRHG